MSQKNNKDNVYTLRTTDENQWSPSPPSVSDRANLDFGGGTPHHAAMDFVTPREFASEIRRLEERMDGHVSRIEGSVGSIATSVKETQAAISNLKTTTIVTAIGAVLTIVLGVAAFNATVLSNMVASFESGKNTAASLEKAANDIGKTRDELVSIKEQLVKNTQSQGQQKETPAKQQ